jgi:hypothetical protein
MSTTCPGCGAPIEFEVGTQTLTCRYCRHVSTIERPENAIESSVEEVIPLALTHADIDRQVLLYIASGEFTPDDMLESATISLRECFYVPAFVFRIDYDATWSAAFGFNHSKPYTAYRSVTRNGSSHREAYTNYRTETNWQAASGEDVGIFDVAGYAGSKLINLPLAPAELVQDIVAGGGATEFNPSFIEGSELEPFTQPEAQVYTALHKVINTEIDRRVEANKQGDRQKNWHWNAKMQYVTTTIAVPICHVVFHYGDKNYNMWLGGQNGNNFRADPLPVDREKKNQIIAGLIPFAAAVIAMILSAFAWGFDWHGLLGLAFPWGYWISRKDALIKYSTSARQSLLTQIQAWETGMTDSNNDGNSNVARTFRRPKRSLIVKTHLDKFLIPLYSVMAMALVSFMIRIGPQLHA